METVINKHFSAASLNYIVPCHPVSNNMTSHRITHDKFRKLLETFRQITDSETLEVQVQTTYMYDDLTLTVDNRGRQRCFMDPVQFTYDDTVNMLRYIKRMEIPLSVSRFKPSKDYNYSRQSLKIEFESKHFRFSLEALLRDKVKHRDTAAELSKVLDDPEYALSLSYYFYIKSKSVDLSNFIPLLI